MELLKAKPADTTNIFLVEIGDWSHDGHNISTVHTMIWEGMHAGDNINNIFENYLAEGARQLGFSFVEDVCSEYEDRSLPKTNMQRLYDVIMQKALNVPIHQLYKKLGVDILDGIIESEGEIDDNTDFVTLVYLQACIGANSVLPIQRIDVTTAKIGGYGLFSAE